MSARTNVLDPSTIQSLRELASESDPRLILEMIALFSATAPNLLNEVRGAARTSDMMALAEKAHALKSLVGNFGALSFCDLCERLEVHAAAKETSSVPKALLSLEDEFVVVQGEIAALESQERKRIA